jgi:hypothetical protein
MLVPTAQIESPAQLGKVQDSAPKSVIRNTSKRLASLQCCCSFDVLALDVHGSHLLKCQKSPPPSLFALQILSESLSRADFTTNFAQCYKK